MLNLVRRHYEKLRMIIQKISLRGQVLFDRNTVVSRKTVFEGGNRVAEGAKVIDCHIGYGTIIGFHADLSCTRVGRYCSIAPQIIRGHHPIDQVSTHPCFYSLARQAGFTYANEQSYEEFSYAEPGEQIAVNIGNDVWLTTGVKILEGVTIGDGAVVLNNAVVNKDVPPYAIVGGVPAKLIRYRFDSETIDWLLNLKWWDKSEEWIKDHAPYFSDPKVLREVLEAENKSQGE